jgi:hypothetical protein
VSGRLKGSHSPSIGGYPAVRSWTQGQPLAERDGEESQLLLDRSHPRPDLPRSPPHIWPQLAASSCCHARPRPGWPPAGGTAGSWVSRATAHACTAGDCYASCCSAFVSLSVCFAPSSPARPRGTAASCGDC